MINLTNKKIIVVAHFFSTGPPQHFEEYLFKQGAGKIFAISHPLLYEDNSLVSEYRIYRKGILEKHRKVDRKKSWSIFYNYYQDALSNVWQVLREKEKWDLFVGAGNLNAFCGLILRGLGRVEKVAYYSIDFIPKRFDNKIINRIYRWVEKVCVKRCDEIWDLAPRMSEGREQHLGLTIKKYGYKQKLVPEGAWMDRIKRYSPDEVNRHSIVFLGHIVERMGVQMVIKAIPDIIKVIPDFKFIIIGKGEYAEYLKELAKKLNVSSHLEFKGYVEDHKEVEDIIARCGLGVATYVDDPSSLTYYADPGKTKIYMAGGVPAIMTDLFYNAHEIKDARGGLVVEYNKDSIKQAILELMENKEKWLLYRNGSVDYMKKLDWNMIFEKQLKRLLDYK